jgi:hypothetical protein
MGTHYHDSPPWWQLRVATLPFDLGEATIFTERDPDLWHDLISVTIEFKNHPDFNFTYTYQGSLMVYMSTPDDLAYDFAAEFQKHFKSIRVEPESNIYLGEE